MKIIIAIVLTALCAAIVYWAVYSDNTDRVKHEIQQNERP